MKKAVASPLEQQLAAPVTALAEDSVAVLVTSLAWRLNRGATNYYQRQFNLAMADFRILLSLGRVTGLNVGEVASAAEVDKAAASRSLKMLQARGLVEMEQTQTRGRAAIVHLTDAGRQFAQRVRTAARRREKRFVASLSEKERAAAVALLHKLIANVPAMNQD